MAVSFRSATAAAGAVSCFTAFLMFTSVLVASTCEANTLLASARERHLAAAGGASVTALHSTSLTRDPTFQRVACLQSSCPKVADCQVEQVCQNALDGAGDSTVARTAVQIATLPWLLVDIGAAAWVDDVSITFEASTDPLVPASPGVDFFVFNDSSEDLVRVIGGAAAASHGHQQPLLGGGASHSGPDIMRSRQASLLPPSPLASARRSNVPRVRVHLKSVGRFMLVQRHSFGSLNISDLDITGRLLCTSNCSGHGKCEAFTRTGIVTGFCQCEAGYSGANCSSFDGFAKKLPSEPAPMPRLSLLIVASLAGSVLTCSCGALCVCLLRKFCRGAGVSDPHLTLESIQEKEIDVECPAIGAGITMRAFGDHQSRSLSVRVDPHADRPGIAFLFASPLVHLSAANKSDGQSGAVPNRSRSSSMCCTPLTQLDTRTELERLRHALLRAGSRARRERHRIRLDAMPATVENLRSVLSRGAHEVVHISSHCCKSLDSLLFEDNSGACHMVHADVLSRLFQNADAVRLVFVNACGSRRLAAKLVTTRRSVIATDGRVSDKVAAFFAQNLYLALSNNRNTLGQAFRIAQDAIRTSPQFSAPQAQQFVLMLAPGGDGPNDPLLFGAAIRSKEGASTADASSSDSEEEEEQSRLGLTTIPAMVEDFLGREADIYKTMRALASRRVVVLSSYAEGSAGSGIGKSALAAATAHRLEARKGGWGPSCWFSDGVVFVRNASNIDDLRSQWLEAVATDPHDTSAIGTPHCPDECTSPQLRLLRHARLRQRTLLVVDQCDRLFRQEKSAETLDFFSRMLQALPHLRILISSHDVPGLEHSTLAYYFKPLILQVRRLSRTDSARLFIRRSHRPLRLAEISAAQDPGRSRGDMAPHDVSSPPTSRDNFQRRNSDSPHRDLVRAMSRHPIMEELDGHPRRISAAAIRVTASLDSIDTLLRQLRGSPESPMVRRSSDHLGAEKRAACPSPKSHIATKLQALARGHSVRRRLRRIRNAK